MKHKLNYSEVKLFKALDNNDFKEVQNLFKINKELKEIQKKVYDFIIELILDDNIKEININCKNELRQTPLEVALAKRCDPKIIEILLENGADTENGVDPNKKGLEDNTLLELALILHKKQEIIQILVENKANLKVKDSLGHILLEQSLIMECDPKIIEILLKNGADIDIIDTKGKVTKLEERAKKMGCNEKIVKMIEEERNQRQHRNNQIQNANQDAQNIIPNPTNDKKMEIIED